MSKLKQLLIYNGFHRILDTRTSSRWFGKFANARIYPPLLRFFIRIYVRVFKINPNEYDFDIDKVKTFNEFFTRRLKPGTRVWESGICSPVDGRVLSGGKITAGKLFQVKGMDFSLEDLTGDPNFKSGSFVNIYLSPGDYHRVHAPFDMHIKSMVHFPGKLFSVSKKNAETIDNLYIKNERVVLSGESTYGKLHFVFVGALNVGSIGLSHFPAVKTNLRMPAITQKKENLEVKKGEEIGWFEMGSTILILIEGTDLSHLDKDKPDNKIKLGESLSDHH